MTRDSRLCVHTITTKPWPIEVAMDKYAAAGIGGITVWRQALEGRNIARPNAWQSIHATLLQHALQPPPQQSGCIRGE